MNRLRNVVSVVGMRICRALVEVVPEGCWYLGVEEDLRMLILGEFAHDKFLPYIVFTWSGLGEPNITVFGFCALRWFVEKLGDWYILGMFRCLIELAVLGLQE